MKFLKFLFILSLTCVSLLAQGTKKIALTFDDGPKAKITEEILEVLKENDAKATFFILGSNGKRYPKILEKIHEDGHQLANHSYNHPNLRKIPLAEVKKELESTNKIITDVTGEKVVYFRPPYGSLGQVRKEEVKKQLGMESVMWNICPKDWEKKSDTDYIAKFLIENSKDNGIVLLHDHSKTAKALKIAIPQLKSQGFEFVTVEELNKSKK
ncbi:polysaccharide deacetylase family protein [Cetobacterium somerae]|jgi:peptidoglycan/xylan/chitin deacetylase (PgdA/CDA1 family)|uniref:polysaccharide deacetylase family protein n=1 Tax=Cetobacterium somerae TaxID=188913 RepID=UPI003D767EDE